MYLCFSSGQRHRTARHDHENPQARAAPISDHPPDHAVNLSLVGVAVFSDHPQGFGRGNHLPHGSHRRHLLMPLKKRLRQPLAVSVAAGAC